MATRTKKSETTVGGCKFAVVSGGCDWLVIDVASGATLAVVEGYAAAIAKADEMEKAAK